MFGVAITANDIVSTSLETATITVLAVAVLVLAGLSWTFGRWRIPLALSGVALLASGLGYLEMTQVWLEGRALDGVHRYVGWFVVQPLQVAALYFFARINGPVPVGVFWRITVAAVLMVLCRYLGHALIFDPTLGMLLSIAFWLYILGELYFGAMAGAVRDRTRPVRLGYFWMRLILTIGWAVYPILHFVDAVVGAGHGPALIVLHTVADLVNLVTVSLIVLAVASQESY